MNQLNKRLWRSNFKSPSLLPVFLDHASIYHQIRPIGKKQGNQLKNFVIIENSVINNLHTSIIRLLFYLYKRHGTVQTYNAWAPAKSIISWLLGLHQKFTLWSLNLIFYLGYVSICNKSLECIFYTLKCTVVLHLRE